MSKTSILLILLIFVPIAIAADLLHWDETIIFVTSILAIIPLSLWLSIATEKIAVVTGSYIGGLINAFFGSATVLIIALMALRQGLVDIVEASITGSILNTLLLLLGIAMFIGGLRFKEQSFQPIFSKINGSAMTIAIIAITLPTIAFATSNIVSSAIQNISLMVSAILFGIYGLILLFSLKNHRYLYDVDLAGDEMAPEPTITESESLEQPSLVVWCSILLAATIAIAVVSDLFVSVIESETEQLGLTASFTGVILLPLVSDVAACIMVIRLALTNQMDLAIATVTGDSLLSALFVAPTLVMVGRVIDQPIDLNFTAFNVIALAITVAIANLITGSGRSNWLDGILLLATYSVLAIVFYYTS